MVISMGIECLAKITGWNFGTLKFKLYQTKCEAMFAAGLTADAVASFLQMNPGAEMKSKKEMQWVTGEGVCNIFVSISWTSHNRFQEAMHG